MLYVEVNRNTAGKVTSAYVLTEAERKGLPHDHCENRNDWRTFEAAQEVAAALGPKYQATDAGRWTSPRYDVQELPQVGQEVSYTFNGDYYPCGKIVKISEGPAFRKITAKDLNGRRYIFWRRCRDGKPTGGAWVMDGTWSMIAGHVSKTNPEF